MLDFGGRPEADLQLYIGTDTYSPGWKIRVVAIRFLHLHGLRPAYHWYALVMYSFRIVVWYIRSIGSLNGY